MIRRRQRGFTLLEVIVALTVLAITLGSIIKATGDYTANRIVLLSCFNNPCDHLFCCFRIGTANNVIFRL